MDTRGSRRRSTLAMLTEETPETEEVSIEEGSEAAQQVAESFATMLRENELAQKV